MLSILLPLLLASSIPSERSPEEILKEIRSKGNQAPMELFEELAELKTEAALEALIKSLSAVPKRDKVCTAFKTFAQFNGVPELENRATDFLLEHAQGNDEKLSLNAAWQLGPLWPASRDALVEIALYGDTRDLRSLALLHMVEHDMSLDSKQLKSLARSKDPAVRYEGVLARTARIEDEAKLNKLVSNLLKSRDSAERLAAVEFLGDEQLTGRFDQLQRALQDDYPPVTRKALSSLERTRTKEAIKILIERLSVAGRGERFRISQALERLTGKSLGTEVGRWQRWWQAEGASFVIPDSPPESTEPAAEAHTTSSFYGLPIHSERLVFAVDSSKSMQNPATTNGASRIEIAQLELSKAIEGLPESSEFDVVHFGQLAWSWKGELIPARSKNKKAAQQFVQQLDLTLGTEIYAALREAFSDPRADAILFLTDGDPQLSLMQNRVALRRIVAQWNRTRHTTVDCITIGTERAWLRQLSELTGGRYQRID